MTRLLLILLLVAAPFPLVAACEVSPEGQALIKRCEGFRPFPYRDSAGKLTVGWGHLIEPGEKVPLTLVGDHAERMFAEDVREHVGYLNRAVRVPLHQGQCDAMADWTFQYGPGNLKSSTLLNRINAERHHEVPGELRRWVNSYDPKLGRKRPYSQIIQRREAEITFYTRAPKRRTCP